MTMTTFASAPGAHAARLGALLMLLSLPLPLHAQIGALAKKMASKAASQAVGASGVTGDSPTFDERVLELTDARISSVVAGVQAAENVTGPGGATRATLLARAGAANDQRNALLEKRDDDLRRYDDDTRRVNMCTQQVLDSLTQVHNEALAKKARALATSADPMGSRLMQDVMQATMESQRLMAAGDTAGAVQVQRALMKKQGIDPARDSTLATARCGKLPAKAAWHQQADSLLEVANRSMRQAQAIDQQSADAGAKAAGMTPQQFAIARERIKAFAAANGNPSSSWRFSPSERKALLPRVQQLKALS